jgi:ABC-2 type transport system ATP-binding protein
MSDATIAIDVNNLSRKFGDKNVVQNLTLNVKKGEIYAFLGPNGAGKSTTVKMLITLLSPTSGNVTVMGKDVQSNDDEVRLIIGAALQEASLDESQTGIEFLKLQGRLYGLTNIQINARINELIKLIDIGDALNKQIKTYSGGMKRRLDLAASIIHNPQVLFLDEPTTGLDPVSRAKVWKEVKRLNEKLGVTIFLTTQYLEEADQLADRVGIISGGKLVAQGTPKELKDSVGEDLIIITVSNLTPNAISGLQKIKTVSKVDSKGNEITVVSASGSSIIGKVVLELNNQNIVIESLTLRTTTLDDVFLEVTGNRLEAK